MRHFLNGSIGCNCAKCSVSARDARNHDLEKRVDEIQNKKKDEESRKAEEHEKEKKLESYRAEIKDLDDTELDALLESLRAEIQELKDQLKDLPDEEKQERDSKLEHVGVDSSLITNTRYHVLTLDQSYRDSKSGDELLILMGSTDDQTKGNAKDDELLKSLGSVD